ncbi:MAG: hypothetical protein ACFCU1_08485 [Sumerlaeia bacterium]
MSALLYVYGGLLAHKNELLCHIWELDEISGAFFFKDQNRNPVLNFRKPDNRGIVSLFGTLLLHAATSTIPSLRVLHGQLLQRNSEHLILLGRKGVGKTTLTRLLIKQGWNSICEDMIPLDIESETVFPYQRAFGLKSKNETANAVLIAGKYWLKQTQKLEVQTVNPRQTRMIELEFSTNNPKSQQVETHDAVLLSLEKSIEEELRAKLPIQEVHQYNLGVKILFKRKLTNQEVDMLAELQDQGTLILSFGESESSGAQQLTRPLSPSLSPAPLADFESIIARHTLRTHFRQDYHGAKTNFKIAKTIGIASLEKLIPGGTIEQTCSLLNK